jgi:hypothetical protein
MSGHFYNPKGYTLTPDPARSRWWKTIHELQVDKKQPVTFCNNGLEYRMDNHLFTDGGSVPKPFQFFISPLRYIGFPFHDSGYLEGGLWVSPQFRDCFEFRKMSRREMDDLLYEMCLGDPNPSCLVTADVIWAAVRLGGEYADYGKGDAKWRYRLQAQKIDVGRVLMR